MNILDGIRTLINNHRAAAYSFFKGIADRDQVFWLRTDLNHYYQEVKEESETGTLLDAGLNDIIPMVQEAAVGFPWIMMAVRPQNGEWLYLQLHVEALECKLIDVREFLAFKERLVDQTSEYDEWLLELDLKPFNREFPKLREPRSIGQGVQFLNRHLSSRLHNEMGDGNNLLFQFLQVHQYRGTQLMINSQVADADDLRQRLRQGIKDLGRMNRDTPYEDIASDLRVQGFEPGWGNTVRRIRNNFRLLSDILEAPAPEQLETFLSGIPIIFDVVILTPHGYFGQDKVLGMPDTGGQIVYILNQVTALEQEMRNLIRSQGLDVDPNIIVVTRLIPNSEGTNCDQALEHIIGTHNAKILRVPFRNEKGEILSDWVSRFKIYPYLERFSIDVERELIGRLEKRPDLIIGNYTDGNLVATLLSRRLQVTQCNIAHALEKTKYLYSALYWRELEEQYHFSCQFTADLIAMNSADFIITSTYQEIAGDDFTPGQYEGYSSFTMPGLFRVIDGIDILDPKFNVVSPGAEAAVFFPYDREADRFKVLWSNIDDLLYGEEDNPDRRGRFVRDERPIIFSMARLDKVKNLTGLVEMYAQNEELRNIAKLLIVGGYIDPGRSRDQEEQEQIHIMHDMINRYDLENDLCWLGIQADKNLAGELYRVVADTGGVFVQPALYEAFGLTVVEAMTTGLPTFATCYGGPSEIIVDGKSGFHFDPVQGEESMNRVLEFLRESKSDKEKWLTISKAAIKRVNDRYNWELYAKRLMTLARIYGYWKFATNLERQETMRYLEMFYGLMYRKLSNFGE